MTRPAFYWITGGIVGIVAAAALANPIAALIAAIVSGLAIDYLEKHR